MILIVRFLLVAKFGVQSHGCKFSGEVVINLTSVIIVKILRNRESCHQNLYFVHKFYFHDCYLYLCTVDNIRGCE